MKVSTAHLALTCLLITVTSQAQVKKGGLFGFGRGNENELSSELFPNADSQDAVAVSTIEDAIKPPEESSSGFNIFKGGQPKKVDNVSYSIEDGQRVESVTEEVVEEKRKRLFSFGKKKTDKVTNGVPKPAHSVPSAPAVPVAYQTPKVSDSSTGSMSSEDLAAIDGSLEKAVQKKGGFFGMFGKKKESTIPTGPSSVNVSAGLKSVPERTTVAATTTASAPKPAPAPAPRNVRPIPASTTAPEPPKPEAMTIANNAPTPEFEGSTTTASVKEKKDGNFLMTPINKLRPSKKESAPVDLTGAETIIQNGEIVVPSSTGNGGEAAASDAGSNMPRQAPRVINGATTYSSWDDVEGTSTSAVEKILRTIR
ncbi:MAG: hypothetical protein ACPGFB_02460 [Verrucomicrobiales bacterium]